MWSEIWSDLLIRGDFEGERRSASSHTTWSSLVEAEARSRSEGGNTSSSTSTKEPKGRLSAFRRRRQQQRQQQPQPHPQQQQQQQQEAQGLSGCSSESEDSAVVDFGPATFPQPARQRSRLAADEVEPWQRFPHLLTGYRRCGATPWQCVASMFDPRLHNETLNAWTMVWSVMAAVMLMHACLPRGPGIGWADASPFWVLFLAQLVHCPVSVGYHTFMPISAATANRWRRTDLCLVLLLNAASTYSLAYFSVPWYTTLALTAAACLSAGAGIHSILSLKQGQSLDRAKMVCQVAGTAAGYYGVVLYRGGAAAAAAWSGGAAPWACLCCPELGTAAALLLCHGVGATCYVCHWPQRQFPRVFDVCGFSHNLMHVLCFIIYNWGYAYLHVLHAKQDEWFAHK